MIENRPECNEEITIKRTRYFQLINIHHNKSLYIPSGAKDFENAKAHLDYPDQKSLGQVWQIVEVDPNGFQKNLYEFVHTRSTLVLTRVKGEFFLKKLLHKSEENEVKLQFGRWGWNQLFYLEQVNATDFPNIYRFRGSEDKSSYLFYDKYLHLEKIDPKDNRCHWEIKPCVENPIINRSCYIENAYTTLTIDVPAGSLKSGCELIQYPLNNRFNQRFNIYKSEGRYKIGNLNSKLFLASNKKPKAGENIKQEENNNEPNQEWSLEYQGKNLYIIRSSKDPSLVVGLRDGRSKAETHLILTNKEEFGLWKIIGFIPH